MAVLTDNEIAQLYDMCPVARTLRLDQRLKHLDDDGSFNGPLQLDTVDVDTIVSVSTAKFGTLSSTVPGSGVTLDATTKRVIEAHGDDNDTARATGTQSAAIYGRLMIYKDNACEDWGVHGLSKMSAVAKTGNVSAGVVGSFEATGTCSTATGSGNTICAGVMGRVGTGTGFTIGAGTYVACVLAFGNQQNATPFTNAGYCGFLATVTDVGTPETFDYGLYIDSSSSITGIGIGTCTTGINVAANLVIPQFLTIGTTTDPLHWDGVASNWLVHTENLDLTPGSVTAHKFVLDAAHSAAVTSGRLECFRAETRSYSTNNITAGMRALVGQCTFEGDCTYVGSGPQACTALIGAVHSGHNLTATGDVFALGLFMGVETSSTFNGKSAFIYCYDYGKTSPESLIYFDSNIGATSNMTYFMDCDGLDLVSHHDFFSDDTVATHSGASDGCIKIRVGATVYEIPIFAA